jgi:CRP/FNR family transcriptional regulator, cyclic AMP receptor protein
MRSRKTVTAITVIVRPQRYYQCMESTIRSSCLSCEFRPDRLFCDMPAESLKAFDEIKSLTAFPRSTVLFAEGRPVRGIYILCDGRAKLSICSETGKRLTLRIAGPGEVLGLGAALSNTPYEVTAELLDNSQVVFVRRKDLQKFLRENRTVCMEIVRMLSQDLHGAYERVCTIAMVRTRRPRTSFRERAMVV